MNGQKLNSKPSDCKSNCLITRHVFAVRVVRIWNSLPEDIVSADRLSLFVRLLSRVNLSEFLIGKGSTFMCFDMFDLYIFVVSI